MSSATSVIRKYKNNDTDCYSCSNLAERFLPVLCSQRINKHSTYEPSHTKLGLKTFMNSRQQRPILTSALSRLIKAFYFLSHENVESSGHGLLATKRIGGLDQSAQVSLLDLDLHCSIFTYARAFFV